MRKLSKKLLLSVLSVALIFIALGTTTFAWFTMNNSVTVTGMSVRTNVSSNLLVAPSTVGTTKAADSAFGTYVDQFVNGQLLPSSTIDGVNFWYTNAAKADGSKESGNYTAVENNTIGSSNAYVDYIVELKADNTSADQAIIKIDKLNLLYNNGAISAEKAYRVAIFIQASNNDNSAYAAIGSAADMIYSLSGAAYFTENSAVDAANHVEALEHLNSALNTMTVAGNSTKYYKVTVRLWLEGEDTTCKNSTFMPLTLDWQLQLGFSLDANATAVTNLGSTATASTYSLSQTLNNVTSSLTATTVDQNSALNITYTAASGYNLPSTITVTVAGNALTVGTDYTWTQSTGVLNINSAVITGAVAITVTGVAQ